MAILKQNSLLFGLSGKLGNIVIKQIKGRTIVCRRPKKRKVKPTLLQQRQMDRFKEAVLYAQAICNDPVKKAGYEAMDRKGLNVFQYALKEYLKGWRTL